MCPWSLLPLESVRKNREMGLFRKKLHATYIKNGVQSAEAVGFEPTSP